jgi:protein gp37
VWLGVSVENEKALHRIRYFNRIAEAGYQIPVFFVSFEPLLERIDLTALEMEYDASPYQWAIIGGESGFDTGTYTYRRCEWEWLQELVQFHRERGVPVFFKQTGRALALDLGIADKESKAGENIDSLRLLGEPYASNTPQDYPLDFFRWQNQNAML